ncbi:ParB N-terminal domain-containing protein [Trichocoleus sp. FACHB-591]|uniref:ParB N-terminal domain-containing protein n=1 Tax=Trichocoleus sp. FACHB-591 TaxID=2692872 RepID=UPI001689ABB8|nr:ParB N-terminal domain-containing protein [Trichocoleus sp. FACHB-591]MBD2097713.1 ParB N-terminal domain-containing protein [Trichocoleus sp. FACHB-591]
MAKRRTNSAALFTEAANTADAIHQQDQAIAAKVEQERAQKTKLPLDRIHPREADTRPIRPEHVADLAESIAALGLIEPLVVDSKGVLLAGAHRLSAIQFLREQNPELYTQQFPDELIQVHMMAFDAEEEPERALQVELAENEKRVNYTRDQIERLAERLRSLNYREVRGRPKEGEKALGPALAVAIGVSTRYVRKVLSDQRQDITEEKNRNSDPIFQKLKLLGKIEAVLEELTALPESEQPTRSEKALSKAIPTFLKTVRNNINETKVVVKKRE